MGWLFGRKKVPKVPFPEGRPMEEGTLRLPGKFSSQRIIEPEQVKEAAGLGKAMTFPQEEPPEIPPLPLSRKTAPSSASRLSPAPAPELNPLFIKMEVYQQVLAEMEDIKSKIMELNHINKIVRSSEYNEEHNFERLKSSVKTIHDRLLDVDKKLFKVQGG